jgi:hypothetical protein
MTYTGSTIELAVAAAIANGTITEAEVGPDILGLLHGGIEFARWYSKEEGGDGSEDT